jgi:hypothetical protein
MDKLYSFNFLSLSPVNARTNATARNNQRSCAVFYAAVAGFALLFGLAGCAQSNGDAPDKAVNEIQNDIQNEKIVEKKLTITPKAINVKAGVSQLFTALDKDDLPVKDVVWSIAGADAGDSAIEETGWLKIADNASGIITVTATAGDASGSSAVAINTTPPKYDDPTSPPPPVNWGVSVTPSSVEIPAGGTQTFAAITGGNVSEDNITWTIEGHKSMNTSITSGGVLNVGADESAAWITVSASVMNVGVDKFGTAFVAIKSAPANPAGGDDTPAEITISIVPPVSRDIKKGGKLLFQTVGSGYSGEAITWNVVSGSGGAKSNGTSIDGSGELTLAEDEAAKTLTISATAGGVTSNTVSLNVIPNLSNWEIASSGIFPELGSADIIAILSNGGDTNGSVILLDNNNTVYGYYFVNGAFSSDGSIAIANCKTDEKVTTMASDMSGGLVFGGDQGTLLYSNGNSTTAVRNIDQNPSAISRVRWFQDVPSRFFAVGSNAVLVSGHNSIISWTATILIGNNNVVLNDMAYSIKTNKLIVAGRNGDSGVIYISTKDTYNDLGWTPYSESSDVPISSIAASSDADIFVAAGQSKLLTYDIDYGLTNETSSGSVKNVMFQKLGHSYSCFIAVGAETIVYSENGGINWTGVTGGLGANAVVYFKPINKFIAVGNGGRVMLTK